MTKIRKPPMWRFFRRLQAPQIPPFFKTTH
uniref:Uncharacterized protein n=1 Tax=Myoviridae sp. ctTK08 TaxID=2826656 RepID=A0A8S5QWG2_9CAUD|nr:MAG TPA: hypothetical protein [Myoviridae sp. ctTK08]